MAVGEVVVGPITLDLNIAKTYFLQHEDKFVLEIRALVRIDYDKAMLAAYKRVRDLYGSEDDLTETK